MADYLTQADVTGRFDSAREVSYLTGTEDTGVPSSDVLDEVIASAEGRANMSFAVRYATPVSSSDAATTAAVKALTLDIAEVYLRLRKPPITPDKQAQLDQAYLTLENVASGKEVLPGAAVPEATTSKRPAQWTGSNRVLSDTSPRIFTRETAGGL